MRNLLENQAVCAKLFLLFALALAVSSVYGGVSSTRLTDLALVPGIAHGPTLPPEPWNKLAHGPTLPPEPWNKLAHGPTLPPEPWVA